MRCADCDREIPNPLDAYRVRPPTTRPFFYLCVECWNRILDDAFLARIQ